MQRRLLISTLAVAVIAVLLFGLPLAFVLSRLQVDGVRDQLVNRAVAVYERSPTRAHADRPAASDSQWPCFAASAGCETSACHTTAW